MQSYRDQLKALGKMPTLEHFFNYYVHMKKPTEMPREIDIHFFREPLVPMWEVSDFLPFANKSSLLIRIHLKVALSYLRSRRMITSTRCGNRSFSPWLVSQLSLSVEYRVPFSAVLFLHSKYARYRRSLTKFSDQIIFNLTFNL